MRKTVGQRDKMLRRTLEGFGHAGDSNTSGADSLCPNKASDIDDDSRQRLLISGDLFR
jgi:hypothetical protein